METYKKPELPKEKDIHSFSKMERLLLPEDRFLSELALSTTDIEDLLKAKYKEKYEKDHQTAVLNGLKYISNSLSPGDCVQATTYIPDNEHAHIYSISMLENGGLRFTYRDNETFNISSIPAIANFFTYYYNPEKLLHRQISLVSGDGDIVKEFHRKYISDSSYSWLLNLYEKKSILGLKNNPGFINSCADQIANSFYRELHRIGNSSTLIEMYLAKYFDNISGRVAREFIEYIENSTLDSIKEDIVSKLQKNYNGLLDIYCMHYATNYFCGDVDFIQTGEGIYINKSMYSISQSKDQSIRRIFDCLALFSNAEKALFQSLEFETKFVNNKGEKYTKNSLFVEEDKEKDEGESNDKKVEGKYPNLPAPFRF